MQCDVTAEPRRCELVMTHVPVPPWSSLELVSADLRGKQDIE